MYVVFGAGQIGAPLIEALTARGESVRVVQRSAKPSSKQVERMTGDATDAAFCRQACNGAKVVFHCMNAPYSAVGWAARLPVLQKNLIEATGAAGAKLVVLENLYPLGHSGAVLNDESPIAPLSEKGRIRARLNEALFAAHRAGQVEVIAGRAAHYFGPGVIESIIGTRFYTRVLNGKSAQLFGNLDSLHCFSYAPDVARGLLSLADADARWSGRAHMLPVTPAMPTREFATQLITALGSNSRIDRVSKLMMQMMGLFAPIMKELLEMHYEWESDYVIDDSAARSRFKYQTTSLSDAFDATARWAKASFTSRRAA